MGNLRKIVGVALAVAIVAGVMVYLLIPKSGTTTNNVVVNEPKTPTNGGSGTAPTGGSGGGGSGSSPGPQTPPSRPPKAHGQNSNGPKHLICLPEKNHEGNGVSQYQGANQYRGDCPAGAAQGSQVHGQTHGHATNAAPQAAALPRLLHAAAAIGGHGNR